MRQIIETTDGKYIGLEFDPNLPIILNGAEFIPDRVTVMPDGRYRYSNSNYVIDAREI